MSSTKGFTVSWRADKREWVGKYRTPAGKWPQKVIPKDIARGPRDRAKALAWLIEFASNAIPLNIEARRRPGGRLLGETFEEWLKLREADERIAPSTLTGYSDLFRNVVLKSFTLAPTRGETTLAGQDVVSLGTDFSLLRGWIRAVTKLHSPGRVRAAFSALRAFYDDAIVEKWFRGTNPLRNEAIVREQPPMLTARERGGVVFVPLAVAQPLLRSPVVPLWRRVRYVLLMTCGLREGEISGLTWRKLALTADPPHVEIDEARRLIRRKGESLGPTKTRTSKRGLPLHPAAVEALLEWREAEDGVRLFLGHAPLDADPVFPSVRTQDKGGFSRPDTAEYLRADLRAAKLQPKDDKGRNFTAHALRKTFGTWLEQSGVDELTRKRLMGHGAHDVTADYYTSENFQKMVDAVTGLDVAWQTGVPFVPPPRPASYQDRIIGFAAEHPEARAGEIAEALEIKRSTVEWVLSRLRSGRLVPALVPSLVPFGTMKPTDVLEKAEPRVGLEPTTCALRNRADRLARGAGLPDETGAVGQIGEQPNGGHQPNDRARKGLARTGTKRSSDGKVTIEVGDVRVSTDVSKGEQGSEIAARLAHGLRQKKVPAMAVGDGLHVVPRRRR